MQIFDLTQEFNPRPQSTQSVLNIDHLTTSINIFH